MDRRGFLRTGATAGLAGMAGAGALPRPVEALSILGRRPGRGTPDDPIRLSSNENPLGLSPAARQAVIDAIPVANRYPGDLRRTFIDRLARAHGVEPDNVLLGNGSTEILQMGVQAAASPRAALVLADPTFEDVPRYQLPFPYRLEPVPLDRRMAHDVGRMREVAEAARRPAVVYLCNPNNPTGTLTPSAEIEEWLRSAPESVLFLIDEAYHEYARDPAYRTALPFIDRPNVVVVRTFSKIYGMAGMRLGYAFAHPDTVRRLAEFIGHNNANQLALAAALASLGDDELVARSLDVNEQGRTVACECLDELELEYLPTHANFLMHRIHGDLDRYIERMREAGIRVGRPFPPMLEWNRLSFGLPEEMARWAEAIRGLHRRGWA